MRKLTLHFDGSCWPNPGGTAAYGAVLELEGQEEPICAEAGVVGTSPAMSNNVAEFHALLIGLRRYMQDGVKQGDILLVRGDSMLVINMMTKMWRPKEDKLYYPTYLMVRAEVDFLEKFGVQFGWKWIPREDNTRCDALSKEHNHAPK